MNRDKFITVRLESPVYVALQSLAIRECLSLDKTYSLSDKVRALIIQELVNRDLLSRQMLQGAD